MKESIYTIPISQVFEPKDGCPLCRLYNQLEQRWVEYIVGAAMMEPAIRIKTNEEGFCTHHYTLMLQEKKRLPVALLLQSHLQYIEEHLEDITPQRTSLFRKQPPALPEDSCFVCRWTSQEFVRLLENVAVVWEREDAFKALYREQEFLCYPHYRQQAQIGANILKGSSQKEFVSASAQLSRNKLQQIKKNVDEFTNLFDHRNAGKQPPKEVATAIPQAVEYLTTKKP